MFQVKMSSGATSQSNHITDLLCKAIVKPVVQPFRVTTPQKKANCIIVQPMFNLQSKISHFIYSPQSFL